MNTLAAPVANAADHIKVTKEILLEPAEPGAIVRTADGGYVLAGTTGKAWATRIDATGKVLWRHNYMNQGKGRFHGAALLPDDSVILCGETEGENVSGLLTHLDRAGKVISEQVLSPAGLSGNRISSLTNCLPFGDGVAVIGKTYSPTFSYWLLTLDGKGKITSDKLSPDTGFETVLPLSDHSFVVHSLDLDHMLVSKIGPGSALQATRKMQKWSILLRPTVEDRSIRLLTLDDHEKAQVLHLDDKLATIEHIDSQITPKTDSRYLKRAYIMPDRSLLLFGNQPVGHGLLSGEAMSASIEWISPDMRHSESYVFEPELASYIVEGAMPTGVPGEFVAARKVVPQSQLLGHDEKRDGLVLSFIQIH